MFRLACGWCWGHDQRLEGILYICHFEPMFLWISLYLQNVKLHVWLYLEPMTQGLSVLFLMVTLFKSSPSFRTQMERFLGLLVVLSMTIFILFTLFLSVVFHVKRCTNSVADHLAKHGTVANAQEVWHLSPCLGLGTTCTLVVTSGQHLSRTRISILCHTC